MTVGKCCKGDVEVGTHCPDCGALMAQIDFKNMTFPLILPPKNQLQWLLSTFYKGHVDDCDRCSGQRLFYEHLKDDT